MKNLQGLHKAYLLFAWQFGFTLLIAAVMFVWLGKIASLSAIYGGLVSIVPSLFFARTLFRYQGARAAKQIVNSFYKGELLKIFLSILLFALVFLCFSVNPLVFFVSYILVQMVFWFAPLIFVNNKRIGRESD
ncbi:ATP synthase subunit I [Legionella adelaidensis]|uniref:ATP synthase subunit I n=1 Tax=Legionella adelaidensis TaxID=45056 RepID=UPI001E37F8A9|nr:ATP synthase subunit I [Legionella adelaidensis]